jgi:hypothetical protein
MNFLQFHVTSSNPRNYSNQIQAGWYYKWVRELCGGAEGTEL